MAGNSSHVPVRRSWRGRRLFRGVAVSPHADVSHLAAARARVALPGLLCTTAALYAATRHPVAPALAVSVLAAVVAWALWRPADLCCMLPALLPVASFTPWTGSWLLDESDLLVLAATGGAYLRCGMDAGDKPAAGLHRTPRSMYWIDLGLSAVLLLGVWRGLDDARGAASWTMLLADLWAQGFYGDYDLPGITLRVAKSLAWGGLLVPVPYRSGRGAPLLLARGMVAWA